MDYPPFPTYTPNAVPAGTTPKYDINKLTELYDILHNVGLHPLPKLRDEKQPIPEVWKGVKRLVERDEALTLQQYPSASGWFIVPSLEPNVNLVILDLDTEELRKSCDPVQLYTRLQAMSLTRFVVYTPASGVHMFYKLPTDVEPPNSAKPHKEDYSGLELRSKAIGVGVASLGGFVQYPPNRAAHKGVCDWHMGEYTLAPYGEYDEIPYMSDEMLTWLKEGDKPVERVYGEEFADSQHGNVLIHAHTDLSQSEQTAVTIEALSYILKEWDNSDYSAWLQLWMSAHSASNGCEEVMNYILNHEKVHFSDGNKGRLKFIRDWRNHKPQVGGYTVASLYYLASKNGWLQFSQADLADNAFNLLIETPRISDWLLSLMEIPKRALLMSQTGSGKTYGIKTLYERLGCPKTVIFVPSIRLAIDMATTLKDDLALPAEAYRDEDTLEMKSGKELVEAHILVTTLQTFGKRLYAEGHGFMKQFGLVYIEECDQLLQQFAKALGENASHVTQEQAELGFKVIRDAFAESGAVWGVDATMTQVTMTAFKAMSDDFVSIKNNYIKTKPNVVFIDDRLAAYSLIYETLKAGRSVVVPCDTKIEAETVVDMMLRLGVVSNEQALAVTADTSDTDSRVNEYTRDVNANASKYRLLSYNSSMASGVSVTAFKPDVVVQICSGFLSPRTNLQILNRYREQHLVYCYYRPAREILPTLTVEAVVTDAHNAAGVEADYLNLPVISRTDLAALRDELRSVAFLDDNSQRRNPNWFYKRLLEQDGRKAIDASPRLVIDRVSDAYLETVEQRRAYKDELVSTWNIVPPARERADMPSSYKEMDIKRALIHQWISDVLNGNIPLDEDPAYVFQTVRSLHKKSKALTAFVFQHRAIRSMERTLANRERAYLSMSPTISRTVLASMLRYLFDDVADDLTPDKLEGRATIFTRIIEDNARLYKAVIKNPNKSIKALRLKHADDKKYCIALAKNIAASVGLKVRSKKSDKGSIYHIANIREVLDFLRWVYAADIAVEFSVKTIEDEKERRSKLATHYRSLSGDELVQFMDKLVDVPLDVAIQLNKF